MNKIFFDEIRYQGSNILFLQDVQSLLSKKNIIENVIFRTSEAEKIDRIIKHGTDRYGYTPRKKWSGNSKYNTNYFHDDLILASNIEDIKKGELEANFSNSFKKFALIAFPILLVYKASFFKHIGEKNYVFKDKGNKSDSLVGMVRVVKKTPVDGWFSEEEGLFYRSLCKKIKGGRIVEIGVWQGLSSSYISKICEINGNEVYLVDHWAGSTDKYHEAYLHDIKFLSKKHIMDQVREICPSANLVEAQSSEAVKSFPDQSVDLVFIDASHNYEAVYSDVLMWAKKVKLGGCICGHDYDSEHEGVVKAVDSFCCQYGYKLNLGSGSIWYINK